MSRRSPYKRPDRFTQAAKKQGYPARSVFKLEEMDRRLKLLRQGMRVLDLGSAPGSWTMYVAQKIGPGGRLLSVDLKPLDVPLPPHVVAVAGDALSLDEPVLAQFAPYDVVLSDMAPNTTGNRLGDQTRSFELFMRALAVGSTLLKVGGSFVGKIFMGEDFPAARAAVKAAFAEDRVIRPGGTRATSYEAFIVGLGRREGAGDAEP